jgi:hypothetical protein
MEDMKKFHFLTGAAVLGICLGLCSCVTEYKVVVGVSPEVKNFYKAFPSLEVDVAAVSDADAKALQNVKNEDYFAPNSALRARIEPKTFYFTEEDTGRATLRSRDKIWKDWNKNKPTTIFVIASLPPVTTDGSADGSPDPRSYFEKMKKSYILARTLKIEVDPQKITKVNSFKQGSEK